jgi:outer membrane lipoprotein-sorting protein
MTSLFVPVLAVVLTQTGEDLAKTQKALEDRIAAAKSVQVAFEGKIESPKGNATVSGSLAIAGDKARVEFALDATGKSVKLVAVSDGVKTVTVQEGRRTESKDTPGETRRAVVVLMARAGVATLFHTAGRQAPKDGKVKKEDPLDLVQVSDFKKLPGEKVGNRDAVVIAYKLKIQDDAPLSATVWLDAQTGLPLKRVVRGEQKDAAFTVTETYGTFVIDPKLDAKLFEFPR